MPAIDAQPLDTLIYVFEIAGGMVGIVFVASMLLAAVRWRRRRRGLYRAKRKQLRPAGGPTHVRSVHSSGGRGP
jgi:hypothetical protein